ncbi:MAG: tRNA (adenosine(37)-N6)-threonylcarbamoyltransferase complex ATPase subunit type 1 TsaE [Planctomycetota bacterium]|nr:tRNA (adenosine(37)-N6)-threonylcarbamoyltransferase complex ATPase subunit type 1 TsaE [Planctomycetota bacterium]
MTHQEPLIRFLKDESATKQLGEELASFVQPGVVIALEGDLGAGKTTFTKGLARALGVDESRVTSPTYLLQQDYPTDRGFLLHHFDVYRLDDPDQFEALGVGETFDNGGVSIVEWADKAVQSMPKGTWWIKIRHSQDGATRFAELQLPLEIKLALAEPEKS